MSCPDETELSAFVARTLDPPPVAQLEAHIADCDECRNLVFALASGTGEAEEPSMPAPLGCIGRFEILGVLGQGAMGIVYRARDPELDRTVALKVKRSRSRLDPDGGERLRREAQALARLAHPNVIAVYETGRHGDGSYIAMEYVDGPSLADWLATSPRQDAVIARMIEAGRGLAAAHIVGLVHRDFKPRNVFVSTSGTAKVGDFGLVRVGEDGFSTATPSHGVPITLTMTGAMLGTPAYMSPEQLLGDGATEASDQFSFCVTLFEALFRRRPFAGTTVDGLLASMNKPLVLPDLPRIPRRIAQVLSRGLSVDPALRFPSMAALLDVLDDRRARRQRRGLAIGAALLSLGAGAVALPRAAVGEQRRGPVEAAELNAYAWHVNFGEMRLHVDERGQLYGVYDQGNGILVGQYANERFVGRWCQQPSRKAPDDAGRVELHFVRGDDRILIEGKWTYGDSRMAAWQDNFYGVSLRQPPSYKLEQRLQHQETCPSP
jgi:eukaryotic-like serine/threonine-protein kinase